MTALPEPGLPEPGLPEVPVHQLSAGLAVRLLALVVAPSGEEAYRVSCQTSPDAAFVPGVMSHAGGDDWHILEEGASAANRVSWTTPDEVFALALGRDAMEEPWDVSEAAPAWPAPLLERLAKRRLSGPGTVAFDAGWFISELATSALDHPLLLTDAASKLGLAGLERATATLSALASPAGKRAPGTGALAELLLQALEVEAPADRSLAWRGEGRLIGELPDGELTQLGADVNEGCRAALGAGQLKVGFAPGEPLGLGLGPLLPADAARALTAGPSSEGLQLNNTPSAGPPSAGIGCVVGEVTPGGAAARAGVRPGMALSQLSKPSLALSAHGPEALSFEEALDAIDARRASGRPLTVTFDTAATMTHLYAVEVPGAAALRALTELVQRRPQAGSRDVGVGAPLDALCSAALLWREETPRLFLGEPGSVSSAHTDMCPQAQMAHGLCGTKLLGVASHAATAGLRAAHEGRSVPTDRPLTAPAARLLGDPALSVAALRPGDLAVFDSGALHFASNGAVGLSGALYHGLITPGALPRLRVAAAPLGTTSSEGRAEAPPSDGDAYSAHLFAPELLRLVERRLETLARLGAWRRRGRG